MVVIDPAHHAVGERVGFVLGIHPKDVVTHFVIDHIDPLPLGVVLAPLLPVLGMDKVDLAILVGFTSGFAPVKVLVPLHLWPF